MTKQELIKRVAERAAMNKRQATALVDAVFAELSEYFLSARVGRKAPRFSFPGFGTFTKKRRRGRSGVNPRTGERILIPDQVTLAFQPGQELKVSLNRHKK
jgi:nucleoid DNA-binding protein